MRKIVITGTSAAASLTGLGSNVTGAAFTLTANDAGDSLAHKITVRNDAATDHSGKTIALVGTDADGRAQTETLTGPGSAATVTSTKYFLTLPSATPSATIGADTFDIGWAADAVSPTADVLRNRINTFNIGFGVAVASATYTVQHTYDGSNWFTHSSVSAETTNQEGSYTSPVAGLRLLWTAAGTATLTGWQVGD